jgi:branched-chain amino acid transport system substrate-binding protein
MKIIAIILACGFLYATPVKIGFITTLSTPAGYLGQDAKDGFMLAIKDGKLNGIEVDIKVANDEFKPALGKKLADKMLKKDGVRIFTGIIFSNVLTAVAPSVLRKKGAFYISANAGPSAFAGKKCNKNYFATAWQNDNLHEAAGALANSLGYKKAALIAPNYPAGRDAISGFKRTFKGSKLKPIYTKLGQSDYGVEISKIKNLGVDSLFIFLPGGMGINFLKQYSANNLNSKIPIITSFVNTDEKILNAIGKPMIGIYSASHWSGSMNLRSKQFVKAFKDAYGREPTPYAAQAYESAMLIGNGLKASKGNIKKYPNKFRNALKKDNISYLRDGARFGNNNHPIQNWHGRVVSKRSDGSLYNKIVQDNILYNHQDAYASKCKLK